MNAMLLSAATAAATSATATGADQRPRLLMRANWYYHARVKWYAQILLEELRLRKRACAPHAYLMLLFDHGNDFMSHAAQFYIA